MGRLAGDSIASQRNKTWKEQVAEAREEKAGNGDRPPEPLSAPGAARRRMALLWWLGAYSGEATLDVYKRQVPLGQLPAVLRGTAEIVAKYGLRVANVFHAGDGNLHPLILYNCNDPVEAQKAEDAGMDILKLCVEVGGCLTGEHGVGVEKRELMVHQFNRIDLDQQMRVKTCLLYTSRCV